MFHSVDLGRIQKALHVFTQAKDGWSTFRGITPDALEDTGTVVKDMRHHVHARVIPGDKLAIVPNYITNSRRANVFRLAVFWEHVLYSFRKSISANGAFRTITANCFRSRTKTDEKI
jgi:hypothetical protein